MIQITMKVMTQTVMTTTMTEDTIAVIREDFQNNLMIKVGVEKSEALSCHGH